MEDLFEALVGIIVVVVAICASASKNKKKNRRPGQKPQPTEKKEARAAKRTPEQKPQRHGKGQRVPQGMAPKDMTPKDMAPESMVPERLQPEDMTPEALMPEPMQATLAEGESHGDGAGCLGGSLAHDESVHQGTEFHAAGTHGTRRVRPAAAEAQTTAPAPRVSVAQLRNAVIWSEILDRPVSMREQ